MFDSVLNIYLDARVKGKRAYNARKARGESGHLTSLDGLLKDIEIISTVDLGVREIPLRKVKGTNSNSRRMVFSKNFLPLEPANSEFAGKWMSLCEAHLKDGIRDSIKVYEYMNYFYVIEGNKRVSVLKYFDAVAISAQIIRLIPKYEEDDPDIKLYYKFLEFYKETNINELWLSKEIYYDELLEELETYNPDLSFYKDKYLHFFNNVYLPFRRLYLELGGKSLDITTGDAFVLYARIYNLQQKLDTAVTRELMPNLIKELESYDKENSMEIKTDALDFERNPIINALSNMMGQKSLKIAFIYAKSVEESGWTRSHELGRLAVQEEFKGVIETKSFENIQDDETLENLITSLVEEGYNTFFTTALVHRKATLSSALIHNSARFFNCSGNRPYVHMSNYYGRSYETKFLTGMLAGALTKTNVIGYTSSDPTPETISSLNAFAIGAKMVNPNVTVKVCWTGVWNSPESNAIKIEKLVHCGVDLISSKNNILSREATSKYGITSMLCTVNQEDKTLDRYIAAPIWKWEVFYKKIINSLINGSYARIVNSSREKKLINFWWGIESGGIDIFIDYKQVPKETVKLIKLMRQLIISEQFSPFSGPVSDIDGNIRIEEGETLSVEEIIEMDWYADNIIILDI